MNYELAKTLKDAGFPLNRDWSPFYVIEKTGVREIGFNNIPTLEELVDACGEDFFGLTRWGEEWIASSSTNMDGAITDDDDQSGGKHGIGLAPLEAVAMLWLKLNKKQYV